MSAPMWIVVVERGRGVGVEVVSESGPMSFGEATHAIGLLRAKWAREGRAVDMSATMRKAGAR